MPSLRSILAFVVTLATVAVGSGQTPKSAFDRDPWPMATAGSVKIFIPAGQSNMQGHAALRTLEYLVYNEQTVPESFTRGLSRCILSSRTTRRSSWKSTASRS